MSDVPSYSSPELPAARPPLSAASVSSLILGILGCVPLVTSAGAIVCAIAGFRATRNAVKRGRGLAAAGLTLGIIGVLIWGGIGGLVIFLVVASQEPRAVLHDFVGKMAAGDTAAAAAGCDGSITATQLDGLHAYVVPFGTYTDLRCTSVNIRSAPAGEVCELGGQMAFASGGHPFTAIMMKNAAGTWEVYGFDIR